jgi:RNA polymerase sigma-70 factor, ECF subfamily
MEKGREFSNKALEDFSLVENAKKGDEKAFGELLNRYQKSVYHMILKMVRNVDDAEDLTIEAFGKAFRNIEKFKPDYSFSTWLFRIATNNSIDFIRKKRLDTLSINTEIKGKDGGHIQIDIKDKSLDPQEEAIKGQKVEFIQMIVTKLPSKYQHLVRLRYFKELSYDEIAKEMDSPLGTIKAQLHRARELLHELVKDKKHTI